MAGDTVIKVENLGKMYRIVVFKRYRIN